MKVVLFCGGHGMRLREYSEVIPKPMVPIGYRPILWNIMKYYAHFGHKDFILCLGHRGDYIKNYFVNYHEYISNDFVYSSGGAQLNLLNKDIDDWTITFVDTGQNSNVGERLKAVEPYLQGEEYFFVNYADGLTDLPLQKMVDKFHQEDKIGMFMTCQPPQSFHVVLSDETNTVKGVSPIGSSGLWINAGYFIFKHEFFDYILPGEDLVAEPLDRLIAIDQLVTYPYRGSWLIMDTFKEKQILDDMYTRGDTPWEVWRKKPLITHTEYAGV